MRLHEKKIGQSRKSLKAMHLDIMHFAVLSLLHDSVKKRERERVKTHLVAV